MKLNSLPAHDTSTPRPHGLSEGAIKQQGATLAIALMLLLIITLIGMSTIQVTQLQEKMSANLQDKEFSFLAAESALTAGEAWVLALTAIPTVTANCQQPCVQPQLVNIDYTTQTSAWWQSHAVTYSQQMNDIATLPVYLIEFLQFVPDTPVVGNASSKATGVYYYQVTARATGASDTAVTLLQTTIARRF